jgi:hypothetical protein
MVDLDKLKEGLTSIGFKESEYDLYLINKNKNKCIFANMPQEYGNYPSIIPVNDSNNFFRHVDLDVIIMYFQGILMDNQIKTIDGIPPLIGFNTVSCAYCDAQICSYSSNKSSNCEGAKKYIDSSFYYCKNCFTPMCPLCREETSVEKAYQNKANLHKFYKRYPKVMNCLKEHSMIYIPSFSLFNQCNCDICKERIELYQGFNIEVANISLYSFGKNRIQWYQNRNIDYDMCMNCALKPKNLSKIEKYKLKVTPFVPAMSYFNFGSILDWLPIYVSNQGDFILYNVNKKSQHYQKTAYCMNRDGYHIYTLDDRYSLRNDIDIIKMNDRIINCKNFALTIEVFNICKVNNEFKIFEKNYAKY